ncbi:MAG: class I SAM-dependent methyltransferase, partial [bacterium]
YQHNDLFGVIHQQRRAIALKYVDELSLSKQSRILEIGCGAGLTTVDLARRGYKIVAVDSVDTMIDLTRRHALESGVANNVNANVGDIHELNFQASSFDLVIALGVTPWLHSLNKALQEVVRVLRSSGYIIINADNRYRLNHLLDPAELPALAPLKKALKKWLEKIGLRKSTKEPLPHRYRINEFDSFLSSVGLLNIKQTILGFGPFTFLKYKVFSESVGIKLHYILQNCAECGFPVLRSTGSQYIVLAKKNDIAFTL